MTWQEQKQLIFSLPQHGDSPTTPSQLYFRLPHAGSGASTNFFPSPQHPERILNPGRPLETSILGKPPPSPPITWPRPLPRMDEEGFQPVISRNTRRHLRQSRSQWSFRIEAKTFTFRLQDSNLEAQCKFLSNARDRNSIYITLSSSGALVKEPPCRLYSPKKDLCPPQAPVRQTQPSSLCLSEFQRSVSKYNGKLPWRPSLFHLHSQGRDASGWSYFLKKLPPLPLHQDLIPRVQPQPPSLNPQL